MGGKGQNASDQVSGNSGMQNLYNAPKYLSDPRMQDILSSYGSGKTSLADALASAKGSDYSAAQKAASDAYNQMWADNHAGKFNGPKNQNGESAIDEAKWQAAQDRVQGLNAAADQARQDAAGGMDRMNALFTNPLTGTKAATDQVMGNELFKPYIDYGKGLIDQHGKVSGQLDEDRNSLMGRDESYGLQDSDLKAYGQASDNISRQFAASDQGLAQMLADRGLSQAPSGAAMQAFSGQMGNKNEQLGQMQLQISQNRINTARGLANDRMNADLQRSGQLQSGIQGMGQLSNQAVNDQFSRNMAGVQQYGQQNKDSLGAAKTAQDVQNEMFGQQQATKGPSFGDILGGMATGLGGAFSGGLGTSLGAGLGKKLGGADIYAGKKPGLVSSSTSSGLWTD